MAHSCPERTQPPASSAWFKALDDIVACTWQNSQGTDPIRQLLEEEEFWAPFAGEQRCKQYPG